MMFSIRDIIQPGNDVFTREMYTISKFVCLLVYVVGVYGTPTHSETCSYWGNVASGYSRVNDDNGARHVTCQAHQNTCNGFNCSGIYNTRIPLMQHLNLSFCFGLTLNHCDNPPSVDYYLQLASPRNAETYERVKVNETKPIGNLSFGTALLHIRPYLFFIYTKESDSSILFEAKIKCKVTTYGFEEWPDQLQVTVFQSKHIPYTPCSGTESVPVLQKPPKCIPYKPSSITTSKPHTGKPYSTKYPPHVKPTKSPVAPTKSTQGPPVTIVTTAKHMPKTSETITMYTTSVPTTAKPHTVKPHPTKYQPHTTTTQHSVAPEASSMLCQF